MQLWASSLVADTAMWIKYQRLRQNLLMFIIIHSRGEGVLQKFFIDSIESSFVQIWLSKNQS